MTPEASESVQAAPDPATRGMMALGRVLIALSCLPMPERQLVLKRAAALCGTFELKPKRRRPARGI